jgi:3-oxoacyl-[acyl-carrier protein] reductase
MAESSNKRLADKVAIVTGSGRGIGRCEALLMAQQGARVVVSDIGSDSEGGSTAANVADEIRAAGGERSRLPTASSRWRARDAPSTLLFNPSAAWTFWSTTRV